MTKINLIQSKPILVVVIVDEKTLCAYA